MYIYIICFFASQLTLNCKQTFYATKGHGGKPAERWRKGGGGLAEIGAGTPDEGRVCLTANWEP